MEQTLGLSNVTWLSINIFWLSSSWSTHELQTTPLARISQIILEWTKAILIVSGELRSWICTQFFLRASFICTCNWMCNLESLHAMLLLRLLYRVLFQNYFHELLCYLLSHHFLILCERLSCLISTYSEMKSLTIKYYVIFIMMFYFFSLLF